MTEQAKGGLLDFSPEVVEEPKRKRGRPRKTPAPPEAKAEVRPRTDHMSVGLLSDEDYQALRKEAQSLAREEHVKLERKKVLAAMLKEERAKFLPEEELVPIQIDLPGHSKAIVIDSVHFQHGVNYVVPLNQKRCMDEIMYRAWAHEYIVGNVNRDRYFRPNERDFNLRPGLEGFSHPNNTIMRV